VRRSEGRLEPSANRSRVTMFKTINPVQNSSPSSSFVSPPSMSLERQRLGRMIAKVPRGIATGGIIDTEHELWHRDILPTCPTKLPTRDHSVDSAR
jgi:hypothetical protein